jgi:ABC-type transporter Mla subunit MlaD
MEHQLRELLQVVRAASKDQGWLRRAAERITQADHQLHYALSQGDVTQARGREVLRRQAEALAAAARELNQTAQFALAKDAPGRVGLEDSLRKLADAAQRFEETARKTSDPVSLQNAFAPVNDA